MHCKRLLLLLHAHAELLLLLLLLHGKIVLLALPSHLMFMLLLLQRELVLLAVLLHHKLMPVQVLPVLVLVRLVLVYMTGPGRAGRAGTAGTGREGAGATGAGTAPGRAVGAPAGRAGAGSAARRAGGLQQTYTDGRATGGACEGVAHGDAIHTRAWAGDAVVGSAAAWTGMVAAGVGCSTGAGLGVGHCTTVGRRHEPEDIRCSCAEHAGDVNRSAQLSVARQVSKAKGTPSPSHAIAGTCPLSRRCYGTSQEQHA